jgi:phosphomannomutase
MEEVLFRANDIRGIYPTEISDELFYHLGLALPSIIKSKKIAIGRDIRLSSNSLFSEIAEGLTQQGIDVLDLGLCDTPYTYFIAGAQKLPCLMVTASHNPKDYNGLKIILPQVHTLNDNQIAALVKAVKTAKKKSVKKQGTIKKYDKRNEYRDFLLKQINKKSLAALKIVIDGSNGMAETIAPLLYAKTPAEIVWINKKADGTFPAHAPNPAISENLAQLQAAVLKNKADLGIMYDGDCDRVAFVDEQGMIIDSSITASIFTHYLLEKYPHSKIVHTTTSSLIFPETIRLYGGKPVVAKVGHRFMKDAMRKEKATFGAEPSGHYYFKSNFAADSGMLASLLFYEILSHAKAPASLLRKTFDKYYSLGEINFKVKDRQATYNKIVSFIKSCQPEWESSVDGYAASKKNQFGDITHATVRISNTESLVRLTVEATSLHCAEQFLSTIKEMMKND